MYTLLQQGKCGKVLITQMFHLYAESGKTYSDIVISCMLLFFCIFVTKICLVCLVLHCLL